MCTHVYASQEGVHSTFINACISLFDNTHEKLTRIKKQNLYIKYKEIFYSFHKYVETKEN